MKYLNESAINLLHNRVLFEEIHQLKSFFISVFSALANEIPLSYLSSIHSNSQGTKISKGNELGHCPYQVLDIIRDFDKEQGFNVRILNWWGRGLFILVYAGRNNRKMLENPSLLSALQFHGYLLSKTASPWDYTKMIDQGCLETLPQIEHLGSHLDQYHHLQMVKKIVYCEDFDPLKNALKEQVDHILNFYEG